MASLYRKDIHTLKGVGEQRARLFQKLGVPSVGALLRYYPRAYEDLSHPCTVRSAPEGTACAVHALVTQSPAATPIRGGMTLYKGKANDGESEFELIFFNNPYVTRLLKEGKTYIFYGKVSTDFLRMQMAAPEIFPAENCPAIHPVYGQTHGLSSRIIENSVKEAMLLLPKTIRDPIPASMRQKYSLCGLREALENIHFPTSTEAASAARRRLIFEELLVLQLGLFIMKHHNMKKSLFQIKKDFSDEFFSLLPYNPTEAQRRAVRESMADMMGGKIMSRLIQGDVGSGKTAVAAALCYSAAKNGFQAALMVPTEVLARQHYHSMKKIFEGAGIHTALLTGSTPAAQKRQILSELANGRISFLIGTHALLSANVIFHRLGLVVTDEQHRFGVAQRAALSAKGRNPHTLVMSATPIPRTLALMIYGDLDLSMLDELPPGRQKILTYAVTSDKRRRVFTFIKKQIDSGHQCYIICPMIDDDKNGMASVKRYVEKLKSEWLPGYSIDALHGRMKPKEKKSVMQRFSQGKVNVLVSTTVVEVGIDVPNATVMLIENAERYGLSQLHQLRGRVGRGKSQSYCILISDAQNGEATERMKTMCKTNDGFKIADADLKLRGPGDFFGNRQHGLPPLKIADMATDMGCLNRAQEAAREILAEDPDLTSLEHRGLHAEMLQLFSSVERS
ncbi:MAG TPA: ATP-dependent DNA helicase RecG [Ruminococcaceae bacterium]|jgi:ATP-dependent DNA helicase RecG|nr:ATP-dependent DNA helicase RecG [Oscillospiraceae bacterium]